MTVQLPATLADVVDRLEGGDQTERDNAQMRSALATFARVIGKPLEDIPAVPSDIGKMLRDANPTLVSVSKSRWFGVKSLVRRALRDAGVSVMPGRAAHALSPAWEGLAARLKAKTTRYGLSRILRHFTRKDVEPGNVTEQSFDEFKLALETTGMLTDPETSFYNTVRSWNLAVNEVAEWPQLVIKLADRRNTYALPWETYPQSFREDVDRYLAHVTDNSPFVARSAKPIKAGTAGRRREMIGQVASGLILSGFSPTDLLDLSVMVATDNAKAGLKYLHDRNPELGKDTRANQADTLAIIAERWVKSPDDAAELRLWARNLRPKRRGMTVKNRTRLRQFDIDANLDALLSLPKKIADRVQRTDNGQREPAHQMMLAVALELLLIAPLRFDNYAGFQVDKNFVTVRGGRKERLHIVIPLEDTKNDKPFEAPLGQSTQKLVERYLRDYRHRLTPQKSDYLFPGRAGARRSQSAFADVLMKFIKRETGLIMNAHLFRHLAGYVYLAENPEGIETVRQLLGHSSSRTTLRYYAEISAEHAARKYEQLIDEKR
jgi:integrase